MAMSRQCCLSSCGFPPYTNVRLVLTFLMALRTMARTFLSHGVSLGSISSRTSSDGMMRFSSAPFVGDYYIHLGVYVFFYWIQILGRGRISINVTERVKRCETKTLELDSCIPLLGRVGNMRPDLIIHGSKSRRQAWLCQTLSDSVRPPEKAFIVTRRHWFYLQFLSIGKPGRQCLGTQLSHIHSCTLYWGKAWINGLSFFLPIGGDRIQNRGQHNK